MEHRGTGASIPCLLETHGRCRVCELITPGSPHFDAGYARQFGASPSPAAPKPATESGEIRAGCNDRDAIAERHMLILGCDYRGGKLGCGCNERRWCGLAKGPDCSEPFAVTYSDCLACVGGRAG